ncbi:uncharacterized protein MYCFIDRAFT_171787 [Pseudocercospora fijiensis CIRAD86]|uniref:Uncharacterized protein n=1 Tax=Pseudocercospora fijiensis (strain CIRAD86) TaxID=383855 RepID=M3A4B1_PSEFD|nr:uncharacterized protein MYCFIDRAFT_171787 [Pseudocercospora fijiensis CIRAD86]EME85949.1 hypothetical protein MYCFIDRAFT_171787 [Pseudocercospora fijiensis CIRAD86]
MAASESRGHLHSIHFPIAHVLGRVLAYDKRMPQFQHSLFPQRLELPAWTIFLLPCCLPFHLITLDVYYEGTDTAGANLHLRVRPKCAESEPRSFISSCLHRRSPQEDYTCSNVDTSPMIQIKRYCPPCSKQKWTDKFWRDYKEVEVSCGADSQDAKSFYAEFERACDLLNARCSRDRPFWSKMSEQDYIAAGGTLEDTKTDGNERKDKEKKRKEIESSRYYLRRRQSNFKQAAGPAPRHEIAEKAEATDAMLLQQLFARTTISTTHDPAKAIVSLDEPDTGDEKAEEGTAPASSADLDAPPTADAPRCQEMPPSRPLFAEAESLHMLASSSYQA